MVLRGVTLALGVAVCGWIAYITFALKPVVLFSWHPITFAVAYLLTTPSALLAMGERSGESNHGKRVALVQYHAYMQTFTFVLMTIGFVVIYINKENNNRPHFTTIHSWVGSAALGLNYLNFFFVRAASVKTYGGKTNWQWKDTGHRASGTLAFLTSGAAVIYGLYSGWGRANLGPQGQLIASVLVGLLHITTAIYLLSSKKQTTKQE
ncbi:hypothetical protein LEN26_002276 [Aphanomyces euteiches]|nr:hypothetical protein AeMF1_013091 [Aphanomyces euteiches]KAH9159578.1 hypothetical protein LEN26_002276 [Aphanomyces euteiches]